MRPSLRQAFRASVDFRSTRFGARGLSSDVFALKGFVAYQYPFW